MRDFQSANFRLIILTFGRSFPNDRPPMNEFPYERPPISQPGFERPPVGKYYPNDRPQMSEFPYKRLISQPGFHRPSINSIKRFPVDRNPKAPFDRPLKV